MKQKILLALILLTVLALVATACGKGTPNDTENGTDIKTEETTAAPAEGSTAVTGETQGENTTGTPDEKGTDGASETSAESASEGVTEKQTEEQTNEPTSVETQAETQGEAETEAETTAPNLFTYDHITLTLPEDFIVVEADGSTLAVSRDYPAKSDNISFTKAEKDDVTQYSRELLDSVYRQTFGDSFVSSASFDRLTAGGKDAFKYSYLLKIENIPMVQVQFIIFGETYSDILVFTSVTGDYDTAFDQCMNSITVSD